MTPEEKARIKIDQWFADAGWEVVDREDYEPTCTAVAIREGLLKGNLEADYFLFINGKAVGILEVSLISIRCIKSHCLLSLLQMVKNYTFVIFVNKIHISDK